MSNLTARRLRSLLSYDRETGVFRWRRLIYRGPKHAGDIAGSGKPWKGMRIIIINHTKYPAHRLAWLYVHGEWPKAMLIPKNGDFTDCRIANLEPQTPQQREHARTKAQKNSKTGLRGVTRTSRGTFQARIKSGGVPHSLGTYTTAQAASDAYWFARDLRALGAI